MSATKQKDASDRVVGVLSAIYFAPSTDLVTGEPTQKVLTALQGETVSLSASEETRLERNGALLPKGATSEQAAEHAQAKVDAFRGQRGDQEALARHQARVEAHAQSGDADVVNVDAAAGSSSVADLAEWLKEAKPNVDDTVALAEDDPELAQKVLDAETAATGGKPRQGVVDKLERIVAGS